MGNRAVITFEVLDDAPCIYLHWNGGRASVQGFLDAAKRLGMTPGDTRETQTQFMDEFAALLAKHFFDCEVGMTVYREKYGEADTDNWDNGTYVLWSDLAIARRLHKRGPEEYDAEKQQAISDQIYFAASPASLV